MILKPSPFFAPLALPYAAVVRARAWAYDRELLPIFMPPVLTISIGGLEAGGSGKTPVTAVVLRLLCERGRTPGLLSRGYGRTHAKLVVRARGQPADPHAIGDEPAMLVASGLDVAVAACPVRRLGATALLALGMDTLVLDDGFQHRALGRDVDIVVLRGEAPLGTGHLLPFGALREPVTSLRRAHIVWMHYRDRALAVTHPLIERVAPAASVITSEASFRVIDKESSAPRNLAGVRVVAAAGIARPQDMFARARRMGAEVLVARAYRDHHRFSRRDVAALIAAFERERAEAVLVSAKDAIKLAWLWPRDVPLWILQTEPVIVAGAEALAARLGLDR